MKFTAIIPARYASTRFPGKPLAVLGGKTVIQRVYEQVSSVLDEVYVATDDERIFQCVEDFGGRAVMTRSDHKSGTDRIEEAAQKTATDADVIINVQGDEPFIQPTQIETLMHLFDNPQTQIGTLGKLFESIEAVENPNSPKIVVDNQGFALYFSRSVIPYIRGKGMILAKKGHSVVLFEKDKIGGTCLNKGCIPTKSFLHMSEIFSELRSSDSIGISAENVKLDFFKITDKKNQTVEKVRKSLELAVKNSGVTVIYEEA